MSRLFEIIYKWRLILVSLFVFCSAAFIYNFKPDSSGIYPGCPFKYITGYECPGCGSLRATYYLLHTDLVSAMDKNLLAVLLLPFILYSYLNFSIKVVLKLPHSAVFVKAGYIWTLLGVIILFGIVRNLHFSPFIYLAS